MRKQEMSKLSRLGDRVFELEIKIAKRRREGPESLADSAEWYEEGIKYEAKLKLAKNKYNKLLNELRVK